MLRYSETARQQSNSSIVELQAECEADPEPSDAVRITLARFSFELMIRAGNGNFDPAA